MVPDFFSSPKLANCKRLHAESEKKQVYKKDLEIQYIFPRTKPRGPVMSTDEKFPLFFFVMYVKVLEVSRTLPHHRVMSTVFSISTLAEGSRFIIVRVI